eukprot:scaffold147013_cov32-Tisochrysis_lutea.AAC.4
MGESRKRGRKEGWTEASAERFVELEERAAGGAGGLNQRLHHLRLAQLEEELGCQPRHCRERRLRALERHRRPTTLPLVAKNMTF